jgi:hypothetical protein
MQSQKEGPGGHGGVASTARSPRRGMIAPGMQRERLLNRRLHEVVQFDHGRFTYVAGIGHFDDGRLAELFLTAAKTGTAMEAAARDAAIVASLALQYGVPLNTLRHALTRNGDGSPSSPLGRLLDLLASNAEGLQSGGQISASSFSIN